MSDYEEGMIAAQWARENIPTALDARDGYPSTRDIVNHSPEWTSGYIARAIASRIEEPQNA